MRVYFKDDSGNLRILEIEDEEGEEKLKNYITANSQMTEEVSLESVRETSLKQQNELIEAIKDGVGIDAVPPILIPLDGGLLNNKNSN